MTNRDYLYTSDMVESGRTAELTAGERAREAADIARDEAKMNRYVIEQVSSAYYIKDTQIEGDDGFIGPYAWESHARTDKEQFEREDAKKSGEPLNQQLINAGKASGHTIALTQVIAEMHKLVDEPWCRDEHKLLLSILLRRIKDLKP